MRALARSLLLVGLAAGSAAAEPREPHRPTGLGSGDARLLPLTVKEKRVEQGILTPVPIALELPSDMPAARVLVHYRVHGSVHWTTLELTREGKNRFRGAIPCLEVSTITGDLRYYVRVHDAEGAIVAYRGTRADPLVVRVTHESERPDLRAGGRCPDPADCPRGLPGCPSAEVERLPCNADADCEGGATCGWDGFCEFAVRRRNWLGVGLSGAVGLVSGTGACSLYSQEEEGYACYRQSDGARYLGSPLYTNEPLRPVRGQLVVKLGYERLIFYDATLGARVGYAFLGTAPDGSIAESFVPLSAEAHATHWFGRDPFSATGWSPFVSLSGGFAMFDLRGTVHVHEDPTVRRRQGGNDLEQTLDFWKRSGDAFASISGGVALKPTLGTAWRGEVGVAQAFPYSATLLTLSVAGEAGF